MWYFRIANVAALGMCCSYLQWGTAHWQPWPDPSALWISHCVHPEAVLRPISGSTSPGPFLQATAFLMVDFSLRILHLPVQIFLKTALLSGFFPRSLLLALSHWTALWRHPVFCFLPFMLHRNILQGIFEC